MKLKIDFVTNSSSSSFVVMGTYINHDQLTEDHAKIINEATKQEMTLAEIKKDFTEYIDILLENTDLNWSTGGVWEYDPDIMIGIHYTNMSDDETLGQLKTRVSAQLKETFGIDVSPTHMEVAWEDR